MSSGDLSANRVALDHLVLFLYTCHIFKDSLLVL